MKPEDIIKSALEEIDAKSNKKTDGKWLEDMTVKCAPLIKDWDIMKCWKNENDRGVDIIAVRRDGKQIAIQCKSRKRPDAGSDVKMTWGKDKISNFVGEASEGEYAEKWLVSNVDVILGKNIPSKDIKVINIESALRKQIHAEDETRSAMQSECVEESVRILKEHAEEAPHDARGRITLPCGTGKSRIALRIIEKLVTSTGEVSVVLCPSISLVAQLRREFLNQADRNLRVMCVCSDPTAGAGSDLSKDPTLDMGQARVSDVKGFVTTDPTAISDWMDTFSSDQQQVRVIFSTYQSSHKVAEAIKKSCKVNRFSVVVADEAHRTAGIRKIPRLEEKIRDFTICHDQAEFPAKYRVYQTATPKVYDLNGKSHKTAKYVVNDMDHEKTFGVELYRKSYIDAVKNQWLSDYRIIALAVNDKDTYDIAHQIAADSKDKLTLPNALRGLAIALVMGGVLRRKGVEIRSSINFMNTVKKSEKMTDLLQEPKVRDWVRRKMKKDGIMSNPGAYQLKHLDAESSVAQREEAKLRLSKATKTEPYGIINVGIFGEGTDAPSLSAVGFFEARKSPVDVIQAVGRVMRRSPEKRHGYIIVPIVIPPGTDAETWLRNSAPKDGWRELGQILIALRAHDVRIEKDLSEMMQIYLPPTPDIVVSQVAIARPGESVEHLYHEGAPGHVESDVEAKCKGDNGIKGTFREVTEDVPDPEPERIVSGKQYTDGSTELREDGVVRDSPSSNGDPGDIDVGKTKKKGLNMVNGKEGRVIVPKKKISKDKSRAQGGIMDDLFKQADTESISVNLLEKSGLTRDPAKRDANLLLDSIRAAAGYLKDDELDYVLDKTFGLSDLDEKSRKEQADGCTIAALLLMNAFLLHQRLAVEGWIPAVTGLDEIKNLSNPRRDVGRQWNDIRDYDFRPIVKPAIEVLRVIEDTGKVNGLNFALRHLASEAEHLALTYADIGSDHAGALYNEVRGNKKSDGAFFTRPPIAALIARMSLDIHDASGNSDWSVKDTWSNCRVADLACGSGTLIAAALTDMKRRAKDCGAGAKRIGDLQKLAVEETIAGLDIDVVSLQMAAAQLIVGNQTVRYERMGVRRMPYGPQEDGTVRVGALELLGHSDILPHHGEWKHRYSTLNPISSDELQMGYEDNPVSEDVIKSVKDVQLIIMNPPYTKKEKMARKFPEDIRERMGASVSAFVGKIAKVDPHFSTDLGGQELLSGFIALAERCLHQKDGVIAMVLPTSLMAQSKGVGTRKFLAKKFQVHTIITSHAIRSQSMSSMRRDFSESILICHRQSGEKMPTRIISLDKMPTSELESANLHQSIGREAGLIPDGWGEISYCDTGRIDSGDWADVVWRSPRIAEMSYNLANMQEWRTLLDYGMIPCSIGRDTENGRWKSTSRGTRGTHPVLKFKGEPGQTHIKAKADDYWVPKRAGREELYQQYEDSCVSEKTLQKSGYLLITKGQAMDSGRLTAVASASKYGGGGDAWFAITNTTVVQAKAASVFLNSTLGRLQIMRERPQKLAFPGFTKPHVQSLRVPGLHDPLVVDILSDCWESTAEMEVPEYSVGECEVRRLWDEAVANALGWDVNELEELRHLLHKEPFVRGQGYNEYKQ